MTESELRGISPKSFNNKLKGFDKREKKEWEKAVFTAIHAGNSPFYKRPLKEKDFRSLYAEIKITIPTKADIEWMDRKFGRKLNVS